MATEIRNSNVYKRITEKDFIYKAIYSLESYVFEKDLLDEKDYILMLKLRDPFNHKVIDETIENVRTLIDDVLINGNFFEAQVYFRPKKVNNETDKLESRPLHSATLNTLIASVVLLNTLLIEIGKDDKTIELTELARMLPSNFYGNIPSDRPEHLFKPWHYQFKEYTDVITSSYYEYTKTKEYRFEVTLDLKNFFPSINPAIIYDEIMSKYSVKYDNADDIQCIKTILSKLLVFKISNLRSDDFKKMYYDCSNIDFLNGEVWTKGIPQGLPHAYFFGNICMVKVADVFQKVIAGENGKAFYYVDDSVIYTNNLKSENELEEKINEVNNQLEELSNKYISKLEEYKKEVEGTSLQAFVGILDRFNYLIKVHNSESEKSTVLEIQDPKYGQANLNAYSKLASMASYDLSKIFSDTEEINLSKKLEAIYQAVEKEIKRIREIDPEEDTSNYIKVLFRFKKFFKYRQRRLDFSRSNDIKEGDIDELLSNFRVESGSSNKEKFKCFFDAYDEDILLNEFRFFFSNSPIFWGKGEKIVDKFNTETYTQFYKWNQNGEELTIAYFHKICMSLKRRRKIQIDTDISRYDSILKVVKDNVWNISKSSKQEKELIIRDAIERFFDVFKHGIRHDKNIEHCTIINVINESGLIEQSNNRYKLIKLQTDELYRMLMNAYFSEVVSIDVNDLKYLAKRNNKPIYYNESRVLLFLRNRKFRLENFYLKFKDYRNSEVLDYTLFEVIDYFEKFVQDPVYVDNLIMVHKYTSDIWKNGSKYLHFYTLHNQEHAIELIRSIIMFMKSVNYFQISRRDYYILFISCYLHDISMVLHPNLMESFIKDNKESNIIYSDFKRNLKDLIEKDAQGNAVAVNIDYIQEQPIKKLLVDFFGKLDQYYEGYVRNNHPKQSARFIRKSNDFDFVEDVVKDIVAEISQTHGYDVDEIYKIKSNAKESIVSEKYIKILLRIGDLLDMSSNRISNAILDNSQNSMSATTRFHWISHKAISNVDIQVNYDAENKKEKEVNNSWIGPGSIIENVSFVIHLDVKHLIGTQSSQNCKLNFSISGNDDGDLKPYFNIDIGSNGTCSECNFMCKWMKIKNDYLYKELDALQLYLNRSEANLFKTNIGVKYEFNEGARRLRNSEYENVLKYIENR